MHRACTKLHMRTSARGGFMQRILPPPSSLLRRPYRDRLARIFLSRARLCVQARIPARTSARNFIRFRNLSPRGACRFAVTYISLRNLHHRGDQDLYEDLPRGRARRISASTLAK